MTVAILDEFLVWEIMLSYLSRDTGFQPAFYRITKQVVCTWETSSFQKYSSILYANVGKFLKVRSIHERVPKINLIPRLPIRPRKRKEQHVEG